MKQVFYIFGSLVLLPALALGQQAQTWQSESKISALLHSQQSLIRKHFDGHPDDTLWVQQFKVKESLIVMVYFPGAGPNPLLFKYRGESLVWKIDPLADLAGYKYHPVLSANDNGNIALSWYGTAPWGIHLRSFDERGKQLWSVAVSSGQTEPTSISLLNWRRHGWLIGYGTFEHGRIHLVDFDGKSSWEKSGVALYDEKGGHNPISMIPDSDDSVIVLWYRYGSFKKPRQKDEFAAQRFKFTAQPIWPKPISLGDAPSFAMVSPRKIDLSMGDDGRVKAKLYKGIAGDAVYDVTEYEVALSKDGITQVVK